MASLPPLAFGRLMRRRNSVATHAALLDAAEYCESVVGEYKNRRDPPSICRYIFVVCPWMAELRRAPPTGLRTALVPM